MMNIDQYRKANIKSLKLLKWFVPKKIKNLIDKWIKQREMKFDKIIGIDPGITSRREKLK